MRDNSTVLSEGKLKTGTAKVDVLNRLRSILSPTKFIFILLILLLIPDVFFSVSSAWVQQLFIDTIVDKDLEALKRITIICALCVVGLTFLLYIQSLLKRYYVETVKKHLTLAFFEKINRLPFQLMQKYNAGELVSIGTKDVTKASETVSNAFFEIIRTVVLGITSFIFLVKLNSFLAIVTLITGPLIFFTGRFFDKKVRALSFELQSCKGRVRSALQESLQGMETIKILGLDKQFLSHFMSRKQQENEMAKQSAMTNLWMTETVSLINNVLTIFIIFYVCVASINGSMSVGSILTFLFLLGRVQMPFVNLSKSWGRIQEGLGSAERVFSVIEEEDKADDVKIIEDSSAMDFVHEDDLIVMKNISYLQMTEDGVKAVLKNVNLSIAPGEMVAIVGPSGSGKTTLLRIMCNLYKPSSGSMRINSGRTSDTKTNKIISYVPQFPLLLPGTVKENIGFGTETATDQEIIEAARKSNALEFIEKLDQKFDTVIQESGRSLSGGQRQRIAIARALVQQTPILLMDEPTSSLDNESEYWISESIQSMRGSKTIIIVSHKMSTIMSADRIIVMAGGEIVEQGRHEQLIKEDTLYRRLFEPQH
jgi:ABC-type multidrug transport system, ATPase and permease components